MESIIQISGLTYAYRGHEDKLVLKGIDLEVRKGEFLAIAGRTGCGKSTLCYAINALVPHSFGGKMEGSVFVAGIDTRESTPAEMARKVGIVAQSAESQLVGLTVEEDVEFGLENISLPVPEIKSRSKEALNVVNMVAFKDKSPWNLSGGQKQRLAIASALAFNPEILVLDNPTAELDPIGKEEVLETIAMLNKEHGITIMIVDQELHEVMPYADRLAILDDGRIIMIDSPEKVLDQAQTVRAAGVKLPDVTEIGYQLRKDKIWPGGLAITLDQAEKKIRQFISGGFTPAPLIEREKVNPGEPLIEIQNVSFNYPDGPTVLNDVSLTIRRGEFITMMGQNGTGKTTLAKHLNGLLKPISGNILIEGLNTKEESLGRLATKVGYVFQNPDHQIFSKNVAEELAFGPKNLGWSEENINTAVERALKDIGLEDRAEAEPFFMGLAERKLIAIASILIMEPDVLVLDEPATGADYGVALKIMRYISNLHKHGLTVVIITHDVSLATNYASRLLVMHGGQVALDGTPEDVLCEAEKLRQSKIALPQVAELANRLEDINLPQDIIRVQDMVHTLRGA